MYRLRVIWLLKLEIYDTYFSLEKQCKNEAERLMEAEDDIKWHHYENELISDVCNGVIGIITHVWS